MARQVLFVGKSDATLDRIWPRLEDRGIQVTLATTQRRAIDHARHRPPDLIIVDATVSRSASRLCRSLRRASPHSLLLVLIEEGIDLSDAPCDFELSRPFTPRRFIARVERMLESAGPHLLRVGDLVLDPSTRVVQTVNGEQRLTPKECALLMVLMEHAGEIVSREELMRSIWKTNYLGDTRTLDVHIRWLRKKIEPDPSHPRMIITHRGVGYSLALPESW
ncbi:MAG: response regulator transcription factor [Anaerolineae bacterium]